MTPQETFEQAICYYEGKEGIQQCYTRAYALFLKAVEDGCVDAQVYLGRMLCAGEGVEQNFEEGVKWLKHAVEAGNANAHLYLAILYLLGKGVELDYSRSLELFKLAADKDKPEAHLFIGQIYLNGYGVSIDYNLAFKYFTLASEYANSTAYLYIAEMYRYGLGRNIDIIEAIKWYKQAAEQGDIDALSSLGDIYRYGEGVSIDLHQALDWYQKASEKGQATAALNIGFMYDSGKFGKPDHSTAMKYFIRAADLGDTTAMLQIGEKYNFGEGVEQDLSIAKQWYLKAHTCGDTDAANALGGLEEGENAEEWFKLGAYNDEGYAQYNLARIYQNGDGVAMDFDAAFQWYNKAVENGVDEAYYNLGVMYAYGQGMKVNFNKAKECYIKSGLNSISAIADLWFKGLGVEKHFPESIRLYLQSYTRKGDLRSILRLTDIYLHGIGTEKNYRLALSLLKKIERAGFESVCYNIGCAYYRGIGVTQNKEIARKYWKRVAEYDNDARQALLEEKEPIFRFSDAYQNKGWAYYNEKLFMDEGNDLEYIEKCKNQASLGNVNAFFNIYKTLATRKNRNYEKESLYFENALSAKHPQAMFLDRLYKNRSSISEIDFTTPFYIDEIIESQYGMPSDDEVLGIIFMIFSIIKGYNLKDLPSEAMSTSLYHTYVSLLSDDVQNSKLEEIHRLCTYKDVRNLTEELKEYLLDVLEGDSQGTTLYPSRQVVEMIFQHLKLTLKKSSYDLIGGAAKCAIIDPSITSNLYVKNQRNFAIYSLLTDLLEGNNLFLFNQMKPAKTNSVIAVAFPELRRHQHQDFDVTNEQVDILRFIVEQKAKYKQAVLLVDREFCSCVNTEMYEARKLLFENHCLHKVVELQKGTFGDLDCPSALLFLDFTTTAKEVKFVTGESKEVVSYAYLKNNDYCLNSNLYNQPAAEGENHAEYRLCDLVEINQSFEFIAETAYVVEEADYSGSLLYVLQGRRLLHQRKNQINAYKGPHIFMRYDKGVKLFVHNDDSSISCDTHTYAIKVNTAIVDTSYMAYLLLDKTISEYLSEIVDKKGMFMPRDLLYRKVSIPVDKVIQKQIVEEALIKERQMSGSGVEYNIILISEQSDHLEKQLNEKGINIFQRLSSVNDGECTFEDLYEQYIEDPSKALVDAIIIDTKIDDYEDVLYYFRTIRERNIQIYLLGYKDEIRIAGSKLKEYFLKENRVFDQASDGYLDKLLHKMRDDLDSSNAPQAKIRNKYKAVFEAADALDKKYPDIGISKTVLRYIQTGCNIDDVDNVSGPCGSFRNVCHKLLQVFIGKRLVPDIKPGAIPSLLETGSYYDKKETKKTYVIYKRFMNNYLCKALEYFCKVTNEGVHGSQDSSRLGTAALNILMEFIVWFYENDILNNNLDLLPGQSNWKDITDQIPSHKEKVYTVKSKQVGDKKYFYANNIHISEDKPIKQGMKIKINSYNIEKMGDNEREKIDDEYMVFYASKYDIL